MRRQPLCVVQPLCPDKAAPSRSILVITVLAVFLAACSGGRSRDGLDGGDIARGVKEVMQD